MESVGFSINVDLARGGSSGTVLLQVCHWNGNLVMRINIHCRRGRIANPDLVAALIWLVFEMDGPRFSRHQLNRLRLNYVAVDLQRHFCNLVKILDVLNLDTCPDRVAYWHNGIGKG